MLVLYSLDTDTHQGSYTLYTLLDMASSQMTFSAQQLSDTISFVLYAAQCITYLNATDTSPAKRQG